MINKKHIALVVLSLSIAANSVYAVGLRAEVKAEMREESSEKAGSRPGLLRDFVSKGRAAIGSGMLTAKTDTTLTVTKDGKTYTVNVDSNTQYRRRFWGKGALDEMQVGDTLIVIGLWTDDTHTTIQARLVRDVSIQKKNGVFFGIVKSLTSGGWVMTTKERGDQTVTVSSSTKFVNRKEETIVKTDVVVGARVRVRGLWDRNNSTITEVVQVKDFSLPVVATPTATPTP